MEYTKNKKIFILRLIIAVLVPAVILLLVSACGTGSSGKTAVNTAGIDINHGKAMVNNN